jgi:tRNA-Thr(GGU) m(6)t(6)A37 methyltransferase TsaA
LSETAKDKKLELRPIAVVVNGLKETPRDWDSVVSKIVMSSRYTEGLYRLSKFKHIWVIFGFHRQRDTKLKVHPWHDPTVPIVGVFASRSPTRPNKLGLTLVELVSIHGNTITVKGLDAYDGSPVFDIKPDEDEIDY